MKSKNLFLFLFLCAITLIACETEPHHFQYKDESFINGQLCYAPNPLAPEKDTILCLHNVYVDFVCYNSDYYSYVSDLLADIGGKFRQHEIYKERFAYLAESEQKFYPICGKDFISLIDANTGMMADSISLNNQTIYLRRERGEDANTSTHFYLGDYVDFEGSDYAKPKFIIDTIAPSEKQIMCFDAQRGPFSGNPFLTNDNPDIGF